MNLNHRAARIYDRALDSGKPFSISDLQDQLVSEVLADAHDYTEVVGLAAIAALSRIDKDRTANDSQAALFDVLDQAVSVGPGARVARRGMRFADWTQHLSHVGENASRVNASAARENRRFTALAPFLATGLDTEQAMKAWQAANPGQELA